MPADKESSEAPTKTDDRVRTSFRLDKRLHTELKIRCIREERTLEDIVEDAVRQYLLHEDDPVADHDF